MSESRAAWPLRVGALVLVAALVLLAMGWPATRGTTATGWTDPFEAPGLTAGAQNGRGCLGPPPTPQPTPTATAVPTAPPTRPAPMSSLEPGSSAGLSPSADEPAPGPTREPGSSAGLSPSAEPTPTPRPTPTPYHPLGVDASRWNGSVAWDKARAAGVSFAYVKASQGTGITDDRYVRNVSGARAAGMSVGSYHFYDYRKSGRAQADRFVATMTRYGGLADALPPAVDVECFEPFGAADQAYVRTELRAFVDRVQALTGRQVMIYTGRWSWREVTGDASSFGDLPLWIACWTCTSAPSMPPGWSDWLFWQTGSLRIAGVGRMGESIHWGTDAEVQALRADGGTQPN